MKKSDIEKLLGGYASDTLTEAERAALFEAALEDQNLFDALMAEEPLRELMAQPAARARMLEAVSRPRPGPADRFLGWMGRPATWAAAASLAALVLTVGLVHFASRQKPVADYAAVRESAPAQLAKQAEPAESRDARANERPARMARQEERRRPAEKKGEDKGQAAAGAPAFRSPASERRDVKDREALQMPATQVPTVQGPALPEQVAQAPPAPAPPVAAPKPAEPAPAAKVAAEADETKAAGGSKPAGKADGMRRQAKTEGAGNAPASALNSLRGAMPGGVVGGIIGDVPGSSPGLTWAVVQVGPDGVETPVAAGRRVEDVASAALAVRTSAPGTLAVSAGGQRLFPAPGASGRVAAGRHLVPLRGIRTGSITILWTADNAPVSERHELPINFR